MPSDKPLLNKKDWIAGLEKGLQIIEAFNDTHPRLTASTAARRRPWPAATWPNAPAGGSAPC